MRPNGRFSPNDKDWYEEENEDVPTRRSSSVSSLTWGGLGLVVLALVGLIWVAREPEKSTAKTSFDREAAPLGSVAIAPDGRTLALARTDGALVIQDLDSGHDRELEPSLARRLDPPEPGLLARRRDAGLGRSRVGREALGRRFRNAQGRA